MRAVAAIEKPDRPLLRWHGGKWRLAQWVIAHFPPHRVYVEPFGGAGSVLLRKQRSYAEIYNDLDDEVVTLFRVLRDPATAPLLIEALRLTPFARGEFEASYAPSDEPIERARRLVVRSFMGFGSDGHNREIRTGFRATSNRSGTTPSHDWAHFPTSLARIVERLTGVIIEHRDALEVMRQQDAPTTLHYLDPPYLPATRSQKSRRGKVRYHAYTHEMTESDHARLLAEVAGGGLVGMVAISGYRAPLYDDALKGWSRREVETFADGARPRVECLWLNKALVTALGSGPLFAGSAA
jgi:DNA adenine methylase